MNLKTANEKALRQSESPRPKTEADLMRVIKALTARKHDYGTCVYAMSLSAIAAFNYVASKLGVTGFQASCADLDILTRTRHMKNGFQIVDYANLLYPQYRDKFDDLTFSRLILANKKMLKQEAKRLLKEKPPAAEKVVKHWKFLSRLK